MDSQNRIESITIAVVVFIGDLLGLGSSAPESRENSIAAPRLYPTSRIWIGKLWFHLQPKQVFNWWKTHKIWVEYAVAVQNGNGIIEIPLG